jgi:hypothetical protein
MPEYKLNNPIYETKKAAWEFGEMELEKNYIIFARNYVSMNHNKYIY